MAPVHAAAGDAFVASPGGRVIVGYDASVLTTDALDWAVQEALARYAPLLLVAGAIPGDAIDFSEVGAARRARLAHVADRLAIDHPLLGIERLATVLDPRDVLPGLAGDDDVIVVGASRGNVARRLLLGSVPRSAARRSSCPVVIVHERTRRSTIDTIVVGVDGSSASTAAIDLACSESRFHGAEIEVIHAGAVGDADPSGIVERAVARCRTSTPNPVRGRVVAGHAIDVLVECSRAADLVVLGSRGRSGLATALFGSVALAVASRAHCPTVVTHPRRQREPDGQGWDRLTRAGDS